MEQLSRDWLTEGLIDYEYKKYVLLAYLKDIQARFKQVELYPFFTELLFHYRNLKRISENKELLVDQFPKLLTSTEFNKLKLNYRLIVEDDEVMKIMQEIIAFALPRMTYMLEEGKELHEFVSENIEIETIGISPVYDQEGYLMINFDAQPNVKIYRYQVTIFQNADDKYRGVSTTFVGDEHRSFSRTFEKIKIDLTRKYQELPNPNTFLIVSKLHFPVEATLLPVAKQLVMKNVSVT
jgi:hypothetical protein